MERCLYCLLSPDEIGPECVMDPNGHLTQIPEHPEWNLTPRQWGMAWRHTFLMDATETVEDGVCGKYGHTHYQPCPGCGDVHRNIISLPHPTLHVFTGEDHGDIQMCSRCDRRLRFRMGRRG